jgi:hypothetical protein
LLYGARYSPHDNPAERIWAALKNHVANTAVTWPGRLRQIHSYSSTHPPTVHPQRSPAASPSVYVIAATMSDQSADAAGSLDGVDAVVLASAVRNRQWLG